MPPTRSRALFVLLMAVASCAVVACDGGGSSEEAGPPTVENAIPDRQASAGGDALMIDLGPVFSSPSGTSLSYSASSSDDAVATVEVDEATLTVTPVEGGEADITVTARNEAGEASDDFTVSVFARPPDRP